MATIGKRSNLKVRVGKLESIIERLSNSHPEKALEVISETDSSSVPSTWSSITIQNSAKSGQDRQKELKSPLFDLFDNDVVGMILSLFMTPLNTLATTQKNLLESARYINYHELRLRIV
jgi:hypothetical protein